MFLSRKAKMANAGEYAFFDAVEPDAHESGKYFVRYEMGGDGKLYDPNGVWLADVGAETFRVPIELDRDEIIQQLYNLDRKELRRVAYEALLMSDGPDNIGGDIDDTDVMVDVVHPKAGEYGYFKVTAPEG
jgi:hypothetical protein